MTPGLRRGILLLCAAACLAGTLLFLLASGKPPREGWSPKEVTLPKGVSARQAEEILMKNGVLESPVAFRALFLATPWADVHPGTYLFLSPPTTLSVARRVFDGDVVRFAFTVPPGATAREIAQALSALGVIGTKEFLLGAGPAVRKVFPGVASPEGYLAPGEYLLARGADAEDIALAMATRMRKVVTAKVEAAARKAGLTLHQAITAASIIEKETRNPGERRLVSGVIQRRIRSGMPLQMDPTGTYDPPRTAGSANKHLYDTYRNKGLPPGPIANPGPEAILAAVSPLDRGYLFFVSRGDGSHQFSRTYAEHRRAVRAMREAADNREAMLADAGAEDDG